MSAPGLATGHEPGVDLSALVAARLCHDLISPIGAIGNGLELLQLTQPAASVELDLVAGSLGSALAKLRFYRLAFGPSDPSARLSLDETRALTGAMYQNRFTVEWGAEADELPRSTVQLACLALLCLEKSLPMGGVARIAVTDGEIALAVEGRRTAPPAELWAHATVGAPLPALRPDGVQFALLRRALVDSGSQLDAEFEESAARVRMTAAALTPA